MMARKIKSFDYNDTFPRRLRELIDESEGITQEKIAEVVGATRQTVGNWCSGKSAPDAIALSKIAREFNVSIDWLLQENAPKQVNATLASVCRYTGLHEKAVEMISREQPACKANFLFEETSYKFYLLLLSRFIVHNFYYRNEIFQGCNDAIMYHLKALEVLGKAKESGNDLATMQKAREDALDNIDKSEYAKYIAEKGIRKWIDSEIKSLEAGEGLEKAMSDLVECMESNEEFRKKMHSRSWLTDEGGGGKDGEHPETDQ